jgi:hypothetical protein
MELCGRYFSREVLDRIRQTVESEPRISRRELSRRVCSWLDWRSVNGAWCEVSCRKALAELNRQAVIRLPEIQGSAAFAWKTSRTTMDLPAVPDVACKLEELGRIEVFPVFSRDSKDSRTWNALMDHYHYLGGGPLCGAQIRYMVRSENIGWLGALGFSSGPRHLRARDEWIGWSDRAHRANLRKIICNSRFLILPTVCVKNLASHVLALALARVCQDWEERFCYRPVLAETFVDPTRHKGTCYRAANWIEVGQTAGRTSPFSNGKTPGCRKDIYAYPLCDDWRRILCDEPDTPIVSQARPTSFDDWIHEEFFSVELYDSRLRKRLFQIARSFFERPGALVPQACQGSQAKTKAAYRFFENKKVDMELLLRPHIESTTERIKEHPVVLSVQDTTILDYTSHQTTQGLGPTNTKNDKAVGLILHDTMAFTQEGTPLGLVDAQCWARDPAEAGKRDKRKELPIEQKESFKWIRSYRASADIQTRCPETMIVSVGDREADIYELFYEASQVESGPKLLIRAERSRNRKIGGRYLWDEMAEQDVAGGLLLHIPRRGSQRARDAKLEVRFAELTLNSPKRLKLPSVKVWAVYVTEVDYAADVANPLEWMLLTTVEVRNLEQAVLIVKWYAARWNVETYHKVIKSGCRIKDRLLRTADSLQACFGIDLVVAWRVFFLVKQGRETPDAPCDLVLTEDEWKVLWVYENQTTPPSVAPSLNWATRTIAKMGGFLGRRGDGHPGPTTIWRGLDRLHSMVIFYQRASSLFKARDGP